MHVNHPACWSKGLARSEFFAFLAAGASNAQQLQLCPGRVMDRSPTPKSHKADTDDVVK
jgi:hypothetical protein